MHLRVHFKFFVVNGFMVKLTSKSNSLLLSSFLVKFERVLNHIKNHIKGKPKQGLWGFSVKQENFYLGPDRSALCVLF